MRSCLLLFVSAIAVLHPSTAKADGMTNWLAEGCPGAAPIPQTELPKGKDQAVRTVDGRVFVSHLDTLYGLPEAAVAGVTKAQVGKPFWFVWASTMGAGKCGSFSDPHSTLTNI